MGNSRETPTATSFIIFEEHFEMNDRDFSTVINGLLLCDRADDGAAAMPGLCVQRPGRGRGPGAAGDGHSSASPANQGKC